MTDKRPLPSIGDQLKLEISDAGVTSLDEKLARGEKALNSWPTLRAIKNALTEEQIIVFANQWPTEVHLLKAQYIRDNFYLDFWQQNQAEIIKFWEIVRSSARRVDEKAYKKFLKIDETFQHIAVNFPPKKAMRKLALFHLRFCCWWLKDYAEKGIISLKE